MLPVHDPNFIPIVVRQLVPISPYDRPEQITLLWDIYPSCQEHEKCGLSLLNPIHVELHHGALEHPSQTDPQPV